MPALLEVGAVNPLLALLLVAVFAAAGWIACWFTQVRPERQANARIGARFNQEHEAFEHYMARYGRSRS